MQPSNSCVARTRPNISGKSSGSEVPQLSRNSRVSEEVPFSGKTGGSHSYAVEDLDVWALAMSRPGSNATQRSIPNSCEPSAAINLRGHDRPSPRRH